MDREHVVVSPLLDSLLGKLNSLADVNNTVGLMDRGLAGLRFRIDRIADVVVVAEQRFFLKEIINGKWLEEVQEAAYDADDLLDLIIPNSKIGSRSSSTSTSFLSDRIVSNHSVLYLVAKEVISDLVFKLYKVHKMSLRFYRLLKDGNDIVAHDATKAGLLIRSNTLCRRGGRANLTSRPLQQSKKIFGRDVDKNRILDMLLLQKQKQKQKQKQLSVISILGQEGVGKTTLASMVYDDEKVLANFNLRVWVSVEAEDSDAKEDDFIAEKIGKGIVESVTGITCQLVEKKELDELVRDALESKTCLIVLAGIHFLSRDAWMRLHETWFTVVGPGSSLVVTTCSPEVAYDMATENQSYELRALSSEDSWSLFTHLAFESSISSSEIIAIARKFEVRCLGIPLFLTLLGSIMRFQKLKDEWLYFHDCFEKLSAITWGEECPTTITPLCSPDIHNLLSACYHTLPPHLKRCFSHCSIFPKDGVLEKDKVIRMWIAEGLVQSTTGGKGTLEDIGKVYFEELLCRSFLTDAKWDEFGEVTTCRIHPLIHDFARLIVGFDYVDQAGIRCRHSRKFRQVSLAFHSKQLSISKVLDVPKHTRTLLLLSGSFRGTLDPSLFRLKSLRVLDLSNGGIKKLSTYIDILQHLRYLDLSQTVIERLPNTITNLKYLQTLRLSRCSHLQELPKTMQNMADLRHLDVSLCHLLSHMPSGIGMLTSLQSLPVFVVGKNKGSAHLGELHSLNLRGKLEIKNLENVKYISEARGARLHEKENLHHLGLSWDHAVDGCSKISSDLLLESLWPHSKLKVLDITGYNGIRFPSWMRDSTIHNLAKVSIINCSCEELPPLGQLPCLKELCVRGMTNLRFIGPEFYGDNSVTAFPSLQQIELSHMPVLVEWLNLASLKESTSATIEQTFPCLTTMTVEGCPELRGFPFLPVLKNLVLWNSNKKLLCSLANLRSLSSLVIDEYQVGFPGDLGNSNTLEKLMISHCSFLDCPFEEGIRGLTSVKQLGILYCYDLTSFPMGFRYLTSLQKLDIIECPDLQLIPEVMECLPSLHELIIEGCHLLASLPNNMEYLTGLQKLIIKGCPELSYLPAGLKSISALQYLLISGCPKLAKKLEKDKGEDWVKIAHVPCIIVKHGLIEQGRGNPHKTPHKTTPSKLRSKEEVPMKFKSFDSYSWPGICQTSPPAIMEHSSARALSLPEGPEPQEDGKHQTTINPIFA